jgi:hypothetical protein
MLVFVCLYFIQRRFFSDSHYTASYEGLLSELWIANDLEGRGRGLILSYYPSICLEELRKTTTPSVRIAGLRAEIWTRDILIKKGRVLILDHDVRRLCCCFGF